jgi:diguanylate cyclase (GGDEF)-like protein
MLDDIKNLKQEIRKRDHRILELEELVTTDPMTRLLNRRGFMELAKKIAGDVRWFKSNPRAKREHYIVDSLTILFCDIDNFKTINDSFGHEVGDQILKFIGTIIAEKVRASDFVARFGGEEIVAALVGADEKDGAQKAEEIRRAIKSRVKIPKNPKHEVTISIGVAEFDGEVTLDQLIKQADTAMYQAKKNGRDKVVKASELR